MSSKINILFTICLFLLLVGTAHSADEKLAEAVKEDLRIYTEFAVKTKDENHKKYLETTGRFEDWKRAAELEIPEGQVLLALCYRYGANIPEDKDESVALLRKAALKRNAEAQYQLGYSYAKRIGIEDAENRRNRVAVDRSSVRVPRPALLPDFVCGS